MKQKLLFVLFIFLAPVMAFSQNGTVQNAAISKDAPVNVTMTDLKIISSRMKLLFSAALPMAGSTRD